ncbi:MAG: DNA recombination protein RmuC, partial [Clostridia bacterium]|nr:DNA recombination protein RmuC [Clostridia bacterium]
AKNNEANIKHLNEGLESIRKQNNEKLEAIQKAVDEKLDATLTSRLKTSFDNVIKQIGDVNNAVGEIKGLAKDVSSLNRVLTNVKTKGIAWKACI